MQVASCADSFRISIWTDERWFRRMTAAAFAVAGLTLALCLVLGAPWPVYLVPLVVTLLGGASLYGVVEPKLWELLVDQSQLRWGLVQGTQTCIARDKIMGVEIRSHDDTHADALILTTGQRISFGLISALSEQAETIAREIQRLWPEVPVSFKNAPLRDR
jgi:hypothetical protein